MSFQAPAVHSHTERLY